MIKINNTLRFKALKLREVLIKIAFSLNNTLNKNNYSSIKVDLVLI